MQQSGRSATMVVIEFSAAWPRWLQPTSGGDMAVVAQQYEGRPGSLVTQVATRTSRLEAVGWKLDKIVLVTNGRTDPEATAARSVLARGLLSRLRLLGGGELLLVADERQGSRAGASLRALLGNLQRSLRDGPVLLSARVGDACWQVDAPESGALPSLAKAQAESSLALAAG